MGTSDTRQRIGERLQAARTAKGMSQRALAKATHPSNRAASVSGGYISRIEAGQRFPSLYMIRALADVLDVSAEWLERGEAS